MMHGKNGKIRKNQWFWSKNRWFPVNKPVDTVHNSCSKRNFCRLLLTFRYDQSSSRSSKNGKQGNILPNPAPEKMKVFRPLFPLTKAEEYAIMSKLMLV